MNLNKEIAEFKESFRSGGMLTKSLSMFGFVFAVSSITSLSSKVVEWKGFILDALQFYQNYFVNPLITGASSVNLHYSEAEVHVVTISSVCLAVGMRLLAIGQKAAFQEINSRYDSELKPNLNFYWVTAILVPVGLWLWYRLSNPPIRTWLVAFVALFYPVFIVVPKVIISKLGYEEFEKNRFSYIKGYYTICW